MARLPVSALEGLKNWFRKNSRAEKLLKMQILKFKKLVIFVKKCGLKVISG